MLVPLGMRVGASEVRDRLKLAEPASGEEILGQMAPPVAPVAPAGDPQATDREIKRVSGEIKRVDGFPRPTTALSAEGPSAAISEALAPEDILADQLAEEAAPEMAAMLGKIEAMLAAAGSLEEFAEMLRAGFPSLDASGLAERIAQGMIIAHGAGRAAVEESGG
ncbi:MAG: hypothetical protein CVT86_05230 [Alphaproteobacteria bacterium HGW-Alphaproteobacteria-8]|nr:MAG: hypothetical protein CVT86_05230 [Alphaproteobacteria bacterium HGW-Alphaproteobacteria-8]